MESISTRSDDNECERVAMQYLGKGSKVEVSCSEDGFKGSYFAATIVEVPQKTPWPSNKMHKDSLVVEYENLVTDDGSKPLRELVDLSSIRPSPPSKGNGEPSFEINDVVDAYYSDGWWVGVIDRVLGCREESKRYRVLFNDPRHCMEFDRSLLRPHLDWVGGQWVPPPKQERGHALSNMEKSENVAFDSSMTVEKRDGVIRGQCSPYLRKNKLESDSCTDKTSLHVVSSSKRRPEKLTPRGCSKKLKVGRGYQPVDKSRTMPIEMENEATFSVCGAQGTGHSKQVAVDSQPKAKTERALESAGAKTQT